MAISTPGVPEMAGALLNSRNPTNASKILIEFLLPVYIWCTATTLGFITH